MDAVIEDDLRVPGTERVFVEPHGGERVNSRVSGAIGNATAQA